MVTKINVIKSQKLKSPALLVGLPGIGLVGKIAIDYLVSELKPTCKLYAKVTSDSFPQAVHAKNGVLELISDEIYLYRTKTKDYLFLVGPVQPSLISPSNTDMHYEFSETLAAFAKKVGVKEIYTFAGLNIGDKRQKQRPKVLAVASDKKTKTKYKKLKISNLVFEENDTDTLISGVAGLLIGTASYNYKIPGCCFMGETDQRMVFGDQGSAKNLLAVISKLFNFKFDMKKITKEAKKIEESFNQISTKIKGLQEETQNPINYIR